MPLQVQDLTTLNSTAVQANFSIISGMLEEAFPDVDLKRGVVADLVLQLASVLMTANQTNTSIITDAWSLFAINQNPTIADTDTVNSVLSNYGLVRNPGSTASGTVTIIVSALIPLTIGPDTILTHNGLTFSPTTVYNARINSASVAGTNDRLLTQVATGYAFTINVTASAIGSAYMLTNGTQLTLSPVPTNFVTAYASTDFIGGTDPETNAQLITQQAAGLAIKTWGNRYTNQALITSQPDFTNISALSEIGYGDSEMLRYHSIFPVAFGGRTDLYVRSQPIYQTLALTKTATLIAKTGPVGTWQFSILSDDAPGFYEVTKITQTNSNITAIGYTPSSDVRNFNINATTIQPDVISSLEAVYSRYQTGIIQFVDTDTNASSLTTNVSTRQYLVYVKVMPLIDTLQDFVHNRQTNSGVSDVLVKAAVPCFMSVSFTINQFSTDPNPNINAIKAAVANVINGTSFTGMFSASNISKVAHDLLLGTQMTISNIVMTGRIRTPAGTTINLTDSQVLTIPSLPTSMVSNKTVIFVIDPSNITINTVQVGS